MHCVQIYPDIVHNLGREMVSQKKTATQEWIVDTGHEDDIGNFSNLCEKNAVRLRTNTGHCNGETFSNQIF